MLFRSGCHPDLRGGTEIFQYSAPAAFFFSGSSVTLIHYDQIEEIRVEQFREVFLVIITDKLLIQREINLMLSDPSLSHFQRPESQRQAQPNGWEVPGGGENANLYLTVMTDAMEELGNMNSTNSKVMHILEPRPGFPAKKARLTEAASSREGVYTLSRPQNA